MVDNRFAISVACWALVSLRVVGCFFRAAHDEGELRNEAHLLLNQVCDIPRTSSVGNTLIRCDEARAVLAGGPFLFVVVERALTYLLVDSIAAARRELGSLLQTVGLLGALVVAIALGIRTFALRARARRWEKEQMEAASEMLKQKHCSLVPFRFTDSDE